MRRTRKAATTRRTTVKATFKPVTPTRYVIGAVETGDLRAVLRLAWSQTNQLIPGVFFEEIARHQREYFRVVREEESGRTVGFIIAAKQPGRNKNFLLLAVEPSLLGQGLRRALMKNVQRILKAEGQRAMSVEVPIQDHDLIGFYQKDGFYVIGVESRGPLRDRVVMAKTL